MGVLYANENGTWKEIMGGGAQGPPGAPGPTVVSGDTGNVAVLGSDSFIYVPQSAVPVDFPSTYGEEISYASAGTGGFPATYAEEKAQAAAP